MRAERPVTRHDHNESPRLLANVSVTGYELCEPVQMKPGEQVEVNIWGD